MSTVPFERPDIIRPPSERLSYFLPLTAGCSNNACSFCQFYGARLRMRELAEVKQEIDAVALFVNRRVVLPGIHPIVYEVARYWDGQRVFLQDGDALVYPFDRLKAALEYLNEKFPKLDRVGTYATAQDILRRTPEELKALRDLKLTIFYMGVESGDDRVLAKISKGVTHKELVEAARRAKDAGITMSVTVILGIAGVEGSREHALATAEILTEIDPEFAGALTTTFVPGTPLYEELERGAFHPITPFQSLQELAIIIENARFTDCFFSSMHASNYLSIRGRLPQDKERMLRELESVLGSGDPRLLRPEELRGL